MSDFQQYSIRFRFQVLGMDARPMFLDALSSRLDQWRAMEKRGEEGRRGEKRGDISEARREEREKGSCRKERERERQKQKESQSQKQKQQKQLWPWVCIHFIWLWMQWEVAHNLRIW